MTLNRWLIIFFCFLLSRFIVVCSRALPIDYGEYFQQWKDKVIDEATVRVREEEILGSLFYIIEMFRETSVVSVHPGEETPYLIKKCHRHNLGREEGFVKKDQKKTRAAVLSKNTNIRIAKENLFTSIRHLRGIEVKAAQETSEYLRRNNGSAKNDVENMRATSLNVFLWLLSQNIYNYASRSDTKQRLILYQVTGDIYMKNVSENVSSFTCQIGNSTYFFVSKKFWRHRRNKLNVTIDDVTFRRLNNVILCFNLFLIIVLFILHIFILYIIYMFFIFDILSSYILNDVRSITIGY